MCKSASKYIMNLITSVWFWGLVWITNSILAESCILINSAYAWQEGGGVGDDRFSYAIDGCRRLKWHDARGTPLGTAKSWLPGTGVSRSSPNRYLCVFLFGIVTRRRLCSYKHS